MTVILYQRKVSAVEVLSDPVLSVLIVLILISTMYIQVSL